MFHPRPVVVACFIAFSLGACARKMNNFSAQPSGEVFSNTDVADIVLAANSAEVQQGQLALSKAMSPAVRDFARRMITDHSNAIRNTAALMGSPINANVVSTNVSSTDGTIAVTYTPLRTTSLSSSLAQTSDQTLSALATLSGRQFDQQYMATQVAEHEWLLNALDTSLIPQARSQALRRQLRNMRSEVEDHLRLARSVQASL